MFLCHSCAVTSHALYVGPVAPCLALTSGIVPARHIFGLSTDVVCRRWLTESMQYFCVTIPPAVRPTVLQQVVVGSLTCAKMGVHAVHLGRSDKKQACGNADLDWSDRKTDFRPAHQGNAGILVGSVSV